MHTKGVNTAGGPNRLRFENLSRQLSKVNIDVVHRVHEDSTLNSALHAAPSTGQLGCHFQDELENCKEKETSNSFSKFYYEVWSYVQSLPELIHHQQKVIAILEKYISNVPSIELPSLLLLVSVLGRDLQDDLYPNFHSLFKVISHRLDQVVHNGPNTRTVDENDAVIDPVKSSPNIDIAGKIFECLSYLIKHSLSKLVTEPDDMRQYYGHLLGHNTSYVRDLASKCFTILFRKLKPKVFKSHMKKIVKAMCTHCINLLNPLSEEDVLVVTEVRPIEVKVDAAITRLTPKKVRDIIDGIGLLVFHTSKGVKAHLHSQGVQRVACLLELMTPLSADVCNQVKSELEGNSVKKTSNISRILGGVNTETLLCHVYCCGQILLLSVPKLFRHLRPSNNRELWEQLLLSTESIAETWHNVLFHVSASHAVLLEAYDRCTQYLVEIAIFSLSHSRGRALWDEKVKTAIGDRIIHAFYQLCELKIHSKHAVLSPRLLERLDLLFCRLWIQFPKSSVMLAKAGGFVAAASAMATPSVTAVTLAQELLPSLPVKVTAKYLLGHLFNGVAALAKSDTEGVWLNALVAILPNLKDVRGSLVSSYDVSHYDNDAGDEADASEDDSEDGDAMLSDSSDGVQDFRSRAAALAPDAKDNNELYLSACASYIPAFAAKCLDFLLLALQDKKVQLADAGRVVSCCIVVRWITTVFPDLVSASKELMSQVASVVNEISVNYIQKKCDDYMLVGHLASLLCTAPALPALEKAYGRLAQDKETSPAYVVYTSILTSLLGKMKENPQSASLLWSINELIGKVASDVVPGLTGKRKGLKFNRDGTWALSSIQSDQELSQLVDLIGAALLTPSHWIRVSLLKILTHVPHPQLLLNDQSSSEEPQYVNVADMCLQASLIPINLANSRKYAVIIGNLEVLLRSNRLSADFSRVVIAYNLSMLNVKFEPYWEASSKLLITAVNNAESKKHDFEDATWPLLLQVLNDVTISRKDVDAADLSTMDSEIDLDAGVKARASVTGLLMQLVAVDNGASYASIALVKSSIFYYTFFNDVAAVKTEYMVNSDARVDNNTVYARVFDLLSKCPKITLKRSKHIVSAFLAFLQHQYYKSKSFQDDTELPYLYKIGFFKAAGDEAAAAAVYPALDTKTLKTRLLLFLKAFSTINSPKQLFLHQLLYKYYRVMLSKPDTEVVKLSLDCMLTYKEPYLVPYKDKLKKLLDEGTFRDELVVFNPNVDVDQKHRLELLPVLLTILYGRCVSKSRKSKAARDKGIARRAAVLSYISQLSSSELRIFIHLMVRGILPQSALLALSQASGSNTDDTMDGWMTAIESCIFNIEYSSLREITWERQIGFLYLLEHAIRLLGITLRDFMPHLNKLVSLILLNAHATRVTALKNAQEPRVDADVEDEDDVDNTINAAEDEDEDADLTTNHASSSAYDSYPGKVRTMCLLRLAESVHSFHTVVTPENFFADIFAQLTSLVATLPYSISSSKHPPAILKLIHALVQYDSTEHVVASNSSLIQSTIKCIAAHNNEVEVSKMIIDTINILIDRNESKSILAHAQLIIKSFCRRFLGDASSATDEDSLVQMKLSELRIVPSGSVKGELKLLCRIAEAIFGREEVVIDNLSISNLSTMLLGMLRTYTTSKKVRIEEEWVINIIKIYQSLLWRMVDVKQHIPFVSRLFGPTLHSLSLLNLASVRSALITLYTEMTKHKTTSHMLELSAKSLRDLTSVDSTQLDSRDFDRVMPILQALSSPVEIEGQVSWNRLLGPSFCQEDIRRSTLTTAVLFELIRCLYDSEMVIRTGALAALKNFIVQSGEWSGVAGAGKVNLGWLEVINGIIIPAIKTGIKQGTDSVKKGFMVLLSQIVISLGQSAVIQGDSALSAVYYSDLVPFLHEDPEQNVFENLNHIQLHRRIRALHKIRSILKPDSAIDAPMSTDTASAAFHFSVNTLVNVFLPLAYHSLVSDEFNKKDHLPYIQECSAFIGGVAMQLPWSHYFNLMKSILRQLEKNKVEKEKVLLTTLCHVLDSFHFDISRNRKESAEEHVAAGSDEAEKVEEDEEEGDVVAASAAPDLLPHAASAALNEDSIAYVVINSIMPWVKVFLLKNEKDHKGNNNKVVRTAVAVALTKLINRLQEPHVTAENKRSLFTSLVIAVVGTLKSRDTATRDKARESLSKMALTMGLVSLEPILYELKHSLTDGYQRHIRNYTMRSLLSIVMEKYEAPADFSEFPSLPILEMASNELEDGTLTLDSLVASRPHFDRCIPMIVECVVDDLVGETKEDREVDGALRTVIREAKGSKSNDILEVTARSLLFRPTYAFKALDDPTKVSSIHALTTPLLVALSGCDSPTNVGRISEGLNRVAMGIANNKSVSAQELLLYIHATLEPFVDLMLQENSNRKVALGRITRGGDASADPMEDADDDPYDELPSYMREESSDDELLTNKFKNDKKGKPSRHDNVTGYRANTWLPGERNRLTDQRRVLEEQKKEREARDTVLDGASAPRLTGYNRHKSNKAGKAAGAADTDPCHVAAVKYALVLFNSVMKNSNILDDKDEATRSMVLPFLPLLGQCLRLHGSANVVALAMRCLCTLLTWNLPVETTFSQAISNRILKLMFKGGVLLTSDNELVQACMKGLTSIYQMCNERKPADATAKQQNMPLSEEKTRLLLQLLTVSMMEITSTYQNSAFALIRSILATHVLLPELYDLIDKVIEQIVLSQKKSIRDSSASIVVYFLVHYPIGDNRFQHHIKQLLTNCAYEYEDGRVSAIETLQSLVKLLPQLILDDNAQVIFMTLALRIVNDDSYKCREEAAAVIVVICRRITTEKVLILLDSSLKWLNSNFRDPKTLAIVRTGAQMTAILAQARAEVFKRPPSSGGNANENIVHTVIATIYRFLSFNLSDNTAAAGAAEMARFEEGQGSEEADSGSAWTLCYYLLRLLEQLYQALPAATDFACTHSHTYNKQKDQLLMEVVQEYMLYPHSWVRSVCIRILKLYLERRGITKKRLSTHPDGEEICLRTNGLYQFARKICIILNQPVLPADVVDNCMHCITFVIQAMHNAPELSTKIEKGDEKAAKIEKIDTEAEAEEDGAEEEEEVATQSKLFGAQWVMRRLQGLGTDNRGKRRLHVLTILNHVVSVATSDFVATYARNIIEVPIRAQLAINGPDEQVFNESKEQSSLLLSSLEKKIGSSSYMGLYSEVSKTLSTSKLLKKRQLAQEAITDPQAYASRKISKSKSKKDAEKRKRKKSLSHSAIKGLDDRDPAKKKSKKV